MHIDSLMEMSECKFLKNHLKKSLFFNNNFLMIIQLPLNGHVKM